jgi:hypothetical protein
MGLFFTSKEQKTLNDKILEKIAKILQDELNVNGREYALTTHKSFGEFYIYIHKSGKHLITISTNFDNYDRKGKEIEYFDYSQFQRFNKNDVDGFLEFVIARLRNTK